MEGPGGLTAGFQRHVGLKTVKIQKVSGKPTLEGYLLVGNYVGGILGSIHTTGQNAAQYPPVWVQNGGVSREDSATRRMGGLSRGTPTVALHPQSPHLLPCCPPASPHPGGGNLSSRREGWLQGTVRPGPAQDLSSFTDLEDPHLGSYSAPWLPETGN